MMNLSLKTVSSSLPPSNTMDTTILNFPFFQAAHHHHHHPNPNNTVFFKDDQINPTVENSSFSSFLPAPPPPPANIIDSFFTTAKMDPPGIGLLDDVGGSVDGLLSCTESLGFESSDERRVDDLIENLDEMEEYCLKKKPSKSSNFSKSKLVEKRKVKMFPPPLSSMSQDGKPMSFLQPMRVDGRLKLNEVRIFKAPEILRASREDGRLRLHLIQDDDDENEDEKSEEIDHNDVNMESEPLDEEIDDKEDEWFEERAESRLLSDNHVYMQLEALDEVIDDDDEWHEKRAESRLLSQGGDDGDGLVGRCYDDRGKPSAVPSRHHHHHHHGHHQHDIHVWRQQLMC